MAQKQLKRVINPLGQTDTEKSDVIVKYAEKDTKDRNIADTLDAKVSGPATASDDHIAVFDGTTGKALQNSSVALSDGNITFENNKGITFGRCGELVGDSDTEKLTLVLGQHHLRFPTSLTDDDDVALASDLETKQGNLSSAQLAACNSGITSSKVSTYDGYSTSKQNTLTPTQGGNITIDANSNISSYNQTIAVDDGTPGGKQYGSNENILIKSSDESITIEKGSLQGISYMDFKVASSGTTDYSNLTNKPKINNVELTGNKSLSDLGIQPTIDSTHKISSDNVDDTSTTNKFVTASDKSTWNAKQDTLTAGSNIQINNNVISANYSVATTSTNGLMSMEDKTKLDGIDIGAKNVSINPSAPVTGEPITTIAVGGTVHALQAAQGALPLIGGTMSGDIVLPGNYVIKGSLNDIGLNIHNEYGVKLGSSNNEVDTYIESGSNIGVTASNNINLDADSGNVSITYGDSGDFFIKNGDRTNVRVDEDGDVILYNGSSVYLHSGTKEEPTYRTEVKPSTLAANNTLTLPSETGTLALTSILAPGSLGTATSANNKFTFNLGSDKNGLYLLTHGYTFMLLPVYNLTDGQTYKTSGSFIYDAQGSVTTTTVNYKITGNNLEVWSGNSQHSIFDGLTGYLFKIKLY